MSYQLIEHPLLKHKLTYLRKRDTEPAIFRKILGEMTGYMVYEATRDLTVKQIPIETPMEATQQAWMVSEPLVVVPILRAGSGMLSAALEVVPFAQVGHVGIYRDKFIKNTVEYFFRLPAEVQGKRVLLLDPLLATGDTAVAAAQRLKEYGVGRIQLVTLLASREGIAKLNAHHPDVQIYCLSVERELNKDGYLLPGLGDAGDRLYGTA